MKKWNFLRLSLLAGCAATLLFAPMTPLLSAEQSATQQVKVGVINFKETVEKSKLGQQEQNSFESLKKQAEQMLQQKEKDIRELASKLDDPDYLDSLTQDAEAELKHKFRYMNQELAQQQQALYQTLSQANFKVVQKLTDEVNEAAEEVAKKMNLDVIINEDACFFYANKLDITNEVIKVLDAKANKSE